MAKYELPIYGEDDAVVKRYATNICPWAVFVQAAELHETLKDKPVSEQINMIGEILKCVFKGLTNDELLSADAGDVMNTFQQIVQGGQKIRGVDSKNA